MHKFYYDILLMAAGLITAQDLPAHATTPVFINPLNNKTMNTANDSTQITHQYITVNGIRYHYAEAGKGPLVVLLHGFPELWYSWRHQLTALAQAGYHAVAPDLRGFGASEVTSLVADYSLFQHACDVKALIDHIGDGKAVLTGHDWGANLVWLMAQLYPETVSAVAALSIPFYPEPRDPAVIRRQWPSVFTNFERKGIVEAEFEKNRKAFLKDSFTAFPAMHRKVLLKNCTRRPHPMTGY